MRESNVHIRCFEIARECLAGDPLREVQALEMETDRIWVEQVEGRVFTQTMRDEANAAGYLPAYKVAANALGLAETLAGEVVQSEVAHG
jgi:hypothetical protein